MSFPPTPTLSRCSADASVVGGGPGRPLSEGTDASPQSRRVSFLVAAAPAPSWAYNHTTFAFVCFVQSACVDLNFPIADPNSNLAVKSATLTTEH